MMVLFDVFKCLIRGIISHPLLTVYIIVEREVTIIMHIRIQA